MEATQKNKPKHIKFRPSLFWDIDASKLDPDKNSFYVIERILDFGDDDEIRWMAEYYPREVIKEVVEHSRVLLDKSRSLWNLVYQ